MSSIENSVEFSHFRQLLFKKEQISAPLNNGFTETLNYYQISELGHSFHN